MTTFLFAGIFFAKTSFSGPLWAVTGKEVESVVQGFPEELEIEWNTLNRSLRWWNTTTTTNTMRDKDDSANLKRVELSLPWELLMLWREELPNPVPLTPVVLWDLVDSLLGGSLINGPSSEQQQQQQLFRSSSSIRPRMADELVRIEEFKRGDRVLVRRKRNRKRTSIFSSSFFFYGGEWEPGTSFVPSSLRPHQNLLVLTREEDMILPALQEFRKQQDVLRQERELRRTTHKKKKKGNSNVSSRGSSVAAEESDNNNRSGAVERGHDENADKYHNTNGGEHEEDTTRSFDLPSEEEDEAAAALANMRESELLDQLMDKWHAVRGLVVATERRLYVFQGYSFSHRGYWRFPGAELPPVSQPLKRKAVEVFRPLDLLIQQFCTEKTGKILLNNQMKACITKFVPCFPKIASTLSYYMCKKNYLASSGMSESKNAAVAGARHEFPPSPNINGNYPLDDKKVENGEGMSSRVDQTVEEDVWLVDWADDDETYRNITARDIYKFGYPCSSGRMAAADKEEENSDDNKQQEISYENVLQCNRSTGIKRAAAWLGFGKEEEEEDNGDSSISVARLNTFLRWRLHLAMWGLLVYMLLFVYNFVRHLLMLVVVQVPVAYVVVNLLRHVDTPMTPLSTLVVMGFYAVTPILCLRDIIAVALELLQIEKMDKEPVGISDDLEVAGALTK
eukprot:jgi/Bigna1/78005/fgenesh1_pg.51_\